MLKSMSMVRCQSGWPGVIHMAVWQAKIKTENPLIISISGDILVKKRD